MSEVNCGTKICELQIRLVENCLIHLPSNLTDCNIPCNLHSCETIVSHNTRCSIWMCEDFTTTTKPVTTTFAPSPLATSNILAIFFTCFIGIIFVLVLVVAIVKPSFFQKFFRLFHRNSRRNFCGFCFNSETDPLIDVSPLVRAEARAEVEEFLQSSGLNSRLSIYNENLQLREDSIEVAAQESESFLASQPLIVDNADTNPISSSISSAAAAANSTAIAAKTALLEAKKKVKDKFVKISAARRQNDFSQLHES